MTRLLMLVEGQSEEIFVSKLLTPYLARRGIYVARPVVVWTKRLGAGGGYRGGVSHWSQISKDLSRLLMDRNAWVTTLFDWYGLPDDAPGFVAARQAPTPQAGVRALQDSLAGACAHPRFIPFVALHEFEAWIFSSPSTLAAHFGRPELAGMAAQAVSQAGGPELINHGKATHPKARLQAMNVGFKETSDGPTLLDKIGIDAVRQACPHFDAWLVKLEALAPTGQ